MEANVFCMWCRNPISFDPRLHEIVFTLGTCHKCATAFLQEDWMFDPMEGDPDLMPSMNPNYSMSNTRKIAKELDAMPTYHVSKDPSTKKSERMRRKHYHSDIHNAKIVEPFGEEDMNPKSGRYPNADSSAFWRFW